MRQKENQYFPVITPAHSSVLVQKKIKDWSHHGNEKPRFAACNKGAYQPRHSPSPCADPDDGQGVQTPTLENHIIIGLFSNTGPDPQENHKAAKPAFIVGPSSAR